ncbi:MAG: patatin-like phospholipase family protein [Candidatus Riflebacteria bacterium]|nr:patatin-like phospholipase family protein [Candidatus Riflebacteria bacterium]
MRGQGYRLGLALGGGAARGYFQLGVLRALAEAGIVPDCVCGTSVGALVAAPLAAGVPVEKLERLGATVQWKQDVFNMQETFLNLAFALKSYFRRLQKKVPPGVLESSRVPELINRLIGGRTFSQLKPLVLTACDIVTGEKILFSSPEVARRLAGSTGYLDLAREPGEQSWQNIWAPHDVLAPFEDVGVASRASSCFPGIMSSLPIDCPDLSGNVKRRMLNDGGICDQVPVKPLRALGCRKVLAVHLGYMPLFDQVDHIVAVTMNAVNFIARAQIHENLRLADYVIYDPRIESASFMKIDQNLVQMGYEFTHGRLPEIRCALEL